MEDELEAWEGENTEGAENQEQHHDVDDCERRVLAERMGRRVRGLAPLREGVVLVVGVRRHDPVRPVSSAELDQAPAINHCWRIDRSKHGCVSCTRTDSSGKKNPKIYTFGALYGN